MAALCPRLVRGPSHVHFWTSEFALLAIRLEIDRGDDFVADEDGQGEVAEFALGPWHIRFEDVVVAEEEFEALALDDQRIEGREDVHQALIRRRGRLERFGARPMFGLACVFDSDAHQFLPPHAAFDEASHRRLAGRVHVADEIEAHDALRAQRTVQQIVQRLALRRRPRRPFPAEMPRRQFIGFENADAFADGDLPR